jgi:hypothetical protein
MFDDHGPDNSEVGRRMEAFYAADLSVRLARLGVRSISLEAEIAIEV